MHMFAAVLWDFDGTLVNTEPRWAQAEDTLLARYGTSWGEDAHNFTGRPVIEVCQEMARIIDNGMSAQDVLTEFVAIVAQLNREQDVPWMPGVPQLLADLHEAGVPMAIATSALRRTVQPILDHVDPDWFGAVITADDVDHETAKPHPRPYLDAAAALGVAATDCLVVEDSATGAAAAAAAGAVTLVVDGAATPGPTPRRVHRHDLSGLRTSDLVKLWNLAQEQPVPLASGGGGVLREGERITLTDNKGRRHSIVLKAGGIFHTTKGAVRHDDLIGGPQGVVVSSVGGLEFLALRPTLSEFTVSMPREAAIIYPKEAAQIVMWADVFAGARVLEAGVGSGGLSIPLLRAIGPTGRLHSYERRGEFAQVAARNVENFFGTTPDTWNLEVADLVTDIGPEPIDRAILDMLAPWECIDAVGRVLVPGGLLCCYVATTTQMGRVMETLRAEGGWTEPEATETTTRPWHAEGLAIRPAHGTTGHTGFLVIARRLAPGVQAPIRKRRPAPGAYGPDYHGPRPSHLPDPRNLPNPRAEDPRAEDPRAE